MASAKGLAPQEQDEAIKEIALSLDISEKYIRYDFTDSPYFVIQDRDYQGSNRLEDEDRLYVEILDIQIFKKYTLVLIECDISTRLQLENIDTKGSYNFDFEGCVFYDSIMFDYLFAYIDSFIARHCHFLGDVDICFPFNNDSCFEYCHFEGWVNFTNVIFKKDISFYGSIFERCPNFARTSFKGNINIVNTNLDFKYKHTRQAVINKWLEDNVNPERKTLLYFIANDFRDSFRIFKNTLSKEGNLLDASNYHRVELYCKEIELDSKLKESWNWRDWIDKWQLRLYRHTSDHHTDLLKIISWVLVAIGIFGLLLFACKYGTNLKTFIDNHSKNAFVALFDIPIITQSKIVMWFVYALGFFSLFWKWSRIFFFSSIALCVAYCKPTLIFGAMNLIDKTPRSGVENLLLVIYTLAMILLIFSLQKTARKNSIVPN